MRLRTLKTLIGEIALSLFTLCAAPAAFAQSTCANPVFNGQVNIDVTGNCNITQAIAIQGPVKITVTGGNLKDTAAISGSSVTITIKTSGTVTLNDTVAAIGSQTDLGNITINSIGTVNATTPTTTMNSFNASDSLVVTSSSGDVKTAGLILVNSQAQFTASNGKITLSKDLTSTTGGAVSIFAGNNVLTHNITTGSSTNSGIVLIGANELGGNTVFNIGNGSTNGVEGKITAINGGTSPVLYKSGVYIENGKATSTGGITLANVADIVVTNASVASRSGFIFLNAQAGTLTLPTGKLSADGASGQYGGLIAFSANSITATGNTTLSANDTTSGGSDHLVWIGTGAITYGTSFTVHSDGVHAGNGLPATSIGPVGSVSFTPNFQSFTVQVSLNSPNTIAAQEMISGTGAFTATADGTNSGLVVTGYPLTFAGGAVTMHSRGSNTYVIVGYEGGNLSGTPGITFNGTGAVAIDANGLNAGDNGGSVSIVGDEFLFNSPQVNIAANGPSTGGGNGGTIFFYGSSTTFGASSRAILTANAAAIGQGNAASSASNPAIRFYPGTNPVILGTNAGDFQLSAKGGGSGGDAGYVFLEPFANLTFSTGSTQATTVNVSVPGSNGNGGTVDLELQYGGLTFSGSGYAVSADAGNSQGNGGSIIINSPQAITAGSDAGGIILTALGKGTGDGGKISITSQNAISVATGSLHVTAGSGSGSNGNGGTIGLSSTGTGSNGVIAVNGNLDASASGTGMGGPITIGGGSFIQASGAAVTSHGSTGGNISITANDSGGSMVVGNVDASAASPTGAGGTVTLTSQVTSGSYNMDIFNKVYANGGTTSGNAGSVAVSFTGSPTGTGIELDANAQVFANSVSGGGTGVSFSNPTSDLLVTGYGGTVEAQNATLNFTAPSSNNVTLSFALGSATTNRVLSPLSASGNNIAIQADSETSGDTLRVANITAGSDLSITLLNQEGMMRGTGTLKAKTLEISGDIGNVGSSSSPIITTSIGQLDVNTTGSGSVFITNADPNFAGMLLGKANPLESDNIGGSLTVHSSWDIEVQSSIATHAGSMTIQVDSASNALTVSAAVTLTASGGDLALSVGGPARSTCPASTPSCVPSGMSFGTGTNKADVFLNTSAGIQVQTPIGATVTEANSHLVKLDTNGATADNIVLKNTAALVAQ